MAGVIEQYVTTLRRGLDFDPVLADRLAEEVESHLRDVAEADPAWPSPDAEQRAVARFGLAREIAAQFAADAIDRQARRTWIMLAATVAVTFIAMRFRVMWLDDLDTAISTLAPLIDRYAFIAALSVGIVGWLAFRRSLMPLAICLGGLAASIAAGLARAGLFVDGAPLHVLLAAAGEVGLIALLSWHVFGLHRRLRRMASLRRAL
ncbi:MAG: hypothetical protein EPO55_19980 [Reyranella sp.]|uniref:HAAS signaling domain-containing protein n=1 Tax=Reyranella sp. TaxID=1929291 RepID=UPI0012035A0F|nr:hypothetical protein [Reyranella sp.]TAJ36991.1 MAG: hypothetical protein EPO55_19980 [Reyranella sp.]